jgi:hypothetical protein
MWTFLALESPARIASNVGLSCARQIFSLSQQVFEIAIQPLIKDRRGQLLIAFEEMCSERANDGGTVS